MKEIFLPLKEQEKVFISNFGSVRSVNNSLFNVCKGSYLTLTVRGRTGKTLSLGPLHRLVYLYFKGNIPVGYVIDHLDRNRYNNRIDNLVACSNFCNNCNSNKSKWVRLEGEGDRFSIFGAQFKLKETKRIVEDYLEEVREVVAYRYDREVLSISLKEKLKGQTFRSLECLKKEINRMLMSHIPDMNKEIISEYTLEGDWIRDLYVGVLDFTNYYNLNKREVIAAAEACKPLNGKLYLKLKYKEAV